MKIGICVAICDQVYKFIMERKQSSHEKSYVTSLMTKGTDSILEKSAKNRQRLSSQQKTKTVKKSFMKLPTSGFTCSS